MDIATITGTIESLKALRSLATATYDAKVDADSKARSAEVAERLGGVLDAMFELREQMHQLQSERNELRQRLEAQDAWISKLSAYRLAQTAGGALVYEYLSEPTHYACPSCVNKHEIHPLQDMRVSAGQYRCPGCQQEFPIKPFQRPDYRLPSPRHTRLD